MDRDLLGELFAALGAHLAESKVEISLVVVGGASLASTGLVDRTTKDVDVIATAVRSEGKTELYPATPFPAGFQEAVDRVAKDFGLPADWLNSVIESQWRAGLPPRLAEDIEWREYSTLSIGLVGRKALIPLKFFAAVDQGVKSKHWQDLLTLRPTNDEIDEAASWVSGQDAGEEFNQYIRDARGQLRRDLASGEE